ncbi:MAG: IS21-like element helper ATPase IstB [Planctomycetota bacterium]|jgi:DNA replication protein DnaC
MLNTPTYEKLGAMRLTGMAQAWLDQEKDPEIAGLSFDERFALLVEAEALYRENRRLKRLMRQAKLRIAGACVEDLRCSSARGLERSLVRQLMTGRWLDESQNLLVTGKTGTGKTYVACALAQHACRSGRRAVYRRLTLLLEEMMQARASGTYAKLLNELSRARLLIIDDWGLAPLNETARRDLLEILDDRYNRASTVVTSQLGVKHWHEYIGEPTIADAILDRLVHNAYKIALQGPSLRDRKETADQ